MNNRKRGFCGSKKGEESRRIIKAPSMWNPGGPSTSGQKRKCYSGCQHFRKKYTKTPGVQARKRMDLNENAFRFWQQKPTPARWDVGNLTRGGLGEVTNSGNSGGI